MAIVDTKIHKQAKIAREFFRTTRMPNGVLTPVTISANTDTVKFDVSAFMYVLNGEVRYHTASTAHTFSAVHATGIAKWMHILVMVDRDGTITTKSSPNTGDQDSNTEAIALAAVPSATAGTVAIGIITLLTTSADWDANTDALDAADLAAANLHGFKGDRRWSLSMPGYDYQVEAIRTWSRAASGVAHVEVIAPSDGWSGVITHPRLEVDKRAVANTATTKLRVGHFDYAINGVIYHKDAATQIAFSAAHVVTADKWGAILLQINAAGTVSSKVVGTPQAYTNSAAARAALPSPDTSNVAIGTIVIEAKNATWTAATDDLVAASDLEAVDVLPVTRDRLTSDVTLAIDGNEAEDFTVAEFTYVIDGVEYTKTAATGIDFTASHQVTASTYLAILVAINTAGTVSTKVPLIDGRSQTSAQGFASKALAVAALPSPTPGTIPIGYIVVLADSGGWTANTDDMTAASDLTSVEFVSYDRTTNEIFTTDGATFAASTFTAATLGIEVPPRRGHEGGQIGIYIGGTTGVLADPDVEVTFRPVPLNGEVFTGE